LLTNLAGSLFSSPAGRCSLLAAAADSYGVVEVTFLFLFLHRLV